MKTTQKFKKGAASFYIVAFSTLILLVIATSFAAIIISEISRTSNNDLSQSAYDSALAGVEDAKLAIHNYQECKKNSQNKPADCSRIIEIFDNPHCDMISETLGRSVSGGKIVEESNTDNNMQQYYTCVKIKKDLDNYEAHTSTIKVIRPKFSSYTKDETEHQVTANMIQKIRINWYNDEDATREFGYNYFNGSSVSFPTPNSIGLPVKNAPVISLGLVQTGKEFTLSDFDITRNNQTNRGMVYLVPTNNFSTATRLNESGNYNYNGAEYLTKEQASKINVNALIKSNTKTATNLPYAVYCNYNASDRPFKCSAIIDLPEPINGGRNDDTFMVVVALPYSKSDSGVNFSLEFFCADGTPCSMNDAETSSSRAKLEDVQIEVDSTGRANDMYRRVQAMLENSDAYSLSIMGPLELLGTDNTKPSDKLLEKDTAVLKEYNFDQIP